MASPKLMPRRRAGVARVVAAPDLYASMRDAELTQARAGRAARASRRAKLQDRIDVER
jgi:hypothetical protein